MSEDFLKEFMEKLANKPQQPKKKITVKEIMSDIRWDAHLWEFVPDFIEWYEKKIITPDIDYLDIAEKLFKEYIKKDLENEDNFYFYDTPLKEVIEYDVKTKISFYICVDILKAFFKYYNQFKIDTTNLKPTNRKDFSL